MRIFEFLRITRDKTLQLRLVATHDCLILGRTIQSIQTYPSIQIYLPLKESSRNISHTAVAQYFLKLTTKCMQNCRAASVIISSVYRLQFTDKLKPLETPDEVPKTKSQLNDILREQIVTYL